MYWWWIDYDGNARHFGYIYPGSTITQTSYATHPWLITRMDAQSATSPVGVYIPYAASAYIEIY